MPHQNPVLAFVIADGTPREAYAIEHEGSLWRVPEWVKSQDGTQKRPARIIRLDQLQHQRGPDLHDRYNVVVNEPIPKAVLDGDVTQQGGRSYDVREMPNIVFLAVRKQPKEH
jgi:hypothetical protein